MKYTIWMRNTGNIAALIYDKTNDLETAIFFGKLIINKYWVDTVHVKDVDGEIRAVIRKDGHINSPEVFVRI